MELDKYPAYMSRANVAEYLRVSVRTVDKYRKKGVLKFVKIGGLAKIKKEDLVRQLEAIE